MYTPAMQELHDYLKTVCGDLHVTKGDFDEDPGYPEQTVRNAVICLLCFVTDAIAVASFMLMQTLTIGDFRIGMTHGHQVRLCLPL